MKTITPEFVDELIDFAPEHIEMSSKSLGEIQRLGTVAIFNMLARNRCAYLADEVGMGKTYIALAVMSLLRYFNPQARVIIIAPRQNIQEKWRKEMINFLRNNWRIQGNRVKALDGSPVWEPLLCNNLRDFAHECLVNQDRDFLLRMPSFSLAANDPESRSSVKQSLVSILPWLEKNQIDDSTPESFLDSYAVALNGAMPLADLVIVDEAHNLKRGLLNQNISNRNWVMGRSFGTPDPGADYPDWFTPKAQRVLLLSATPFEDDYADIQRQFEVFGFGEAELLHPSNEDKLAVADLANVNIDVELKRKIVECLMVRRTGGIEIGGRKFTKNMYRREWRQGGLTTHDQPIRLTHSMTRLVLGLMQKKVAEVLKNEKFNNSFQIGMLSSFESFAESLKRERDKTFDDAAQQQQLNPDERGGIDSDAVTNVSHSYENIFRQRLPHPKQDHVVEALSNVFETGEKALIFCRRVATTGEIAGRLSERYNEWLRKRLLASLPRFKKDLTKLFTQYDNEYRNTRLDSEFVSDEVADDGSSPSDEVVAIDQHGDLPIEVDSGGIKSFFEWFFRGEGPPNTLSGAAFQRNRLNNAASRYSILFEDNYLAAILQTTPKKSLSSLTRTLGTDRPRCIQELRQLAYSYFHQRRGTKEGYPRLYVFESYQFAALRMLGDLESELGRSAQIVLQERFPDSGLTTPPDMPQGFPGPVEHLGTNTIFTELRLQPLLMERLWPESKKDVRGAFREREQRRELFSAMVRLGAPFIDLYCLAIKDIGSMKLGRREREDSAVSQLARKFVAFLDKQSNQEGFHAFYELEQAAKTFNTLVAVNFPDIERMKLTMLARYFGATLGHQTPVGDVSGQVTKRLVSQFRMPGYPLVLISTDVLQEGEDLHTFCKRVLHYGIAWTPSSMEQRTGRVDRIGGLLQRNLDGREHEPEPEELIQVHYPHLRDTVEFLQIRRVLRRYNTFLKLLHTSIEAPERDESAINTDEAVLDEEDIAPQYTQELTSAFDSTGSWLNGEADIRDVVKIDWISSFCYLGQLADKLSEQYAIRWQEKRSEYELVGTVDMGRPIDSSSEDHVENIAHDFTLRLRSHIAGEETLLQIESPVAVVDLEDDKTFDLIEEVVSNFSNTKICVEPRISRKLDRVFVMQEILYDADVTEFDDLDSLFRTVVFPAAELHCILEEARDSKP